VIDKNSKLYQAQDFYSAGNFKAARKLLKKIIADKNSSKEELDIAYKLLKATGIDPAATAIFGATFFVIIFLIIKYIL
jgi:thioredoxin-like negative regulator of GroEL